MYKLMLIEDDIKLRELTKEYIEKFGYDVFEIKEFHNIEEQFKELKPDIVLLDINLPYFDGFYLCRAIRKESNIPIIITSARSGDMDQVMAIELGADDYITKPFKFEILLAKIKAALRRAYGEYSAKEDILKVNKLILDENSFKMSYGEKCVELSKNEYKLVKKFIENKDRFISREELFKELWDYSTFVDDNTLTVNVTRIKNKFLELGLRDIIKTKRGVGYIFNYAVIEVEGDKGNAH
ncbi:MAG: response regulator transcription factor [Bacillota bacterium]|nr:response regulator transcription factor [Bacillota bacterium]